MIPVTGNTCEVDDLATTAIPKQTNFDDRDAIRVETVRLMKLRGTRRRAIEGNSVPVKIIFARDSHFGNLT
jgi:hypothetical protein